MIATSDPIYLAGLATLNRISALSNVNRDSQTPLGSIYWNLNNYIAVARGDASLGGTPISATTRAAVLTPSGELQPNWRSFIEQWTAELNAAYPVTVAPTPAPNMPPAPTQPAPTMPMPGVPLAGILDGEIFGINKKLILAGVALYFFVIKDK